MSRRLTAFKVANIAPQVTSNYLVWIPSILTSPFAVEATTMPFDNITTSAITICGIKYEIPVKRVSQGDWSCTLNESILMTSLYQALVKQHEEIYNDGASEDYQTINSWISRFALNNVYIFVTDGVTSQAPVVFCILENCFLKKIDDLSFDSGGATNPTKVKLTFTYSGIQDGIDTVDHIIGGLNLGGSLKATAITAGVAAVTATAAGVKKLGSKARDIIGI